VSVDWAAFVVVFLVTIVGSCGVVAVYSVGLRLVDHSQGWKRRAGIACFVLCALAIAFAVYLIVPQFH
jgi:hypothetical protein